MDSRVTEFLKSTLGSSKLSPDQKKELGHLLQDIGDDRHRLSEFRETLFELARTQVPESHHLVINWLEAMMRPVPNQATPFTRERDLAWFSPGEDIMEQICAYLDQANRSVDICVFTITDDRISERVIAASRRLVEVRIITDNDKALDHGSDVARFYEAGINVRTDAAASHMHHKFALFDRKTLLTGSFNWTKSATAKNQENLVKLQDPHVVGLFQKEFEQLWVQMKPYFSD